MAEDKATLPQVEIDENRRTALVDIFGSGEDYTRNAAQYIMGSIEPELNKLAPAQPPPFLDSEDEEYTPDFSYPAFLSGEHGLGDIPGFEAYTGKPFSDLELVEAFSNLRSGEDLPGTEGFLRGLIPSSAAFYAGLKGAKYGARAGALIGRPVIGGGVGFVGGTLLGQEGMNRVLESDFLFGKEAQYIPGTARTYEALKTAGVWAPYALIPWAIKPDVSWGAAKAIDAHARNLLRYGPTIAAAKGAVRDPKTGALKYDKAPLGLRLSALAEQALGRTAQQARDNPITVGLRETGTVGGAAVAVYAAEPQGEFEKLGAELAGGIIGGFLTPRAVAAQYLPALQTAYRRAKEANLAAAREEPGMVGRAKVMGKAALDAFRSSKQQKATEVIRGFLEKEGSYSQDDIDQLVRALEAAPEAETLAGVKLNLTAGQVTGDPMLQAIEASISQTLGGLSSKQRKEAEKAKTALVGVLGALIDTGDREALRIAGDISYGAFEQSMSTRLGENLDKWAKAWETFSGDRNMNMTVLGQKMYDILDGDLKLAREQEKALWESIDDIPITKFFNITRGVDDQGNTVVANIEETPVPEVIRYFDDKVNNLAFEALSEEAKGKLGTLTKIATEIRSQLGLGGAPILKKSAEQARFDTIRSRLSGQGSLKNFEDIVSGNRLSGRDPQTKQPLLSLADDGSVLPTQENIDALGRIITERAASPTKGAGAALWKETQDLLRAQKDALTSVVSAPTTAAVAATQPLTLQQLVKLRSRALAYAREYGAQEGNSGFAKMASDIAESAKNDIDNFVQAGAADDVSARAIESWTTANSYSRALNDVFSRGFVDDAVTRTRRGDLAIAPENLIKGLKSAADISAPRYSQLLAVDDFMSQNGFVPERDFVGIEGTIDDILRTMVDRTRNEAGELDPQKLKKFIEDFSGEGRPLDYFPTLREDLSKLETANELFTQARDRTSKAMQRFEQQNLYSRLRGLDAKSESVSSIISKARKSDRPIQQLRLLVEPLTNPNVPAETRAAAKEGFLSGVFEDIIGVDAGQLGAKFNAQKAYREFFLPMPRAGAYRPSMRRPRDFEAAAAGADRLEGQRISLMDFLKAEDVVSPQEANRIERLLRELVRYEAMDRAGTLDSALTEGAGPALDFYLRISGSALGTATAKMLPIQGQSLIAGQAGSKIVRKVFDEMPQVSAVQAMQEMMENPALLAEMLKKPKSERDAMKVGSIIKNYLTRAGIITPSRRALTASQGVEPEETQTEAPVAPAPAAKVPGKQSSLDVPQFNPPSQFMPQLAQAAQPAAPGPRPSGQANPQQRAGLASLFPNDPILGAGRSVG